MAWQSATSMQLSLSDACSDAEDRLDQGSAPEPELLGRVDSACRCGHRGETLSHIAVPVTLVGAIATGVFYYKGLRRRAAAVDDGSGGVALQRSGGF